MGRIQRCWGGWLVSLDTAFDQSSLVTLKTKGTPSKTLGNTRLRGVVNGLEDSTVNWEWLGQAMATDWWGPHGVFQSRDKVHPLGQAHTRSRTSWNQVASSSSAKMPCGAAGWQEAPVLLGSKAAADRGLHQQHQARILPHCSAPLRPHQECGVQTWAPEARQTLTYRRGTSGGSLRWLRLELGHVREGGRCWAGSSWGREGQGDTSLVSASTWWDSIRRGRQILLGSP